MATGLVGARWIGKQKGNGVTNILLTMVMKETFQGKERDDVYNVLLQEDRHENAEDIADSIMQVDAIMEIEKSDKMIHLGNLNQICENLNFEPRVTSPFRRAFQLQRRIGRHKGERLLLI